MLIRREEAGDRVAVHAVLTAAFGKDEEAKIVETIRNDGAAAVSLVAEDKGCIVGHVLFSPVTIANHAGSKVAALGPVAVVPDRQRTGIGSRLVQRGLEECKALGFGAVVVLGHPEYYPRSGFQPASRYGLGCEWDVRDEVWMALELIPGYLDCVAGTVVYHNAFRTGD